MSENQTTPPESSTTETLSQDDKNLCMLSHLLAIFTGFIAPLVIWLIKKETSPTVARHALEVLNFQITMSIAYIVAGFTIFLFVGLLLLPALMIFNIVNLILGTLAARDGRLRPYPFSLRLLQ